ncbi:MAG: hypothetical protein LDL51_13780, partial [Chloroflexi bacterium]|nr:hypothetical protein [Chloroflexota bacterium]
MNPKNTPSKKSARPPQPGLEIQAGDESVAVGGSVTDSAIIHGKTIVLADRFWRDFTPELPAEKLRESTAAYLNYLNDRHYYLSLKGMGISDRVPLKLKLLDLYVPLKARMELPEGDTWRRDLSLAGREILEEQDLPRFGHPVSLLDV